MASGPQATTAGGNAAFHSFNNDFAHIQDPKERRRLALAEIDKAPFGWYHVRACVVAGIGFFTDSYDVSTPMKHHCLHLTSAIDFRDQLRYYYVGSSFFPGQKVARDYSSNSDTAIKVATSGGTVLGQLGFGYLADVSGRKKMYGLELIIVIFATLAQALSSSSRASYIYHRSHHFLACYYGKQFVNLLYESR